MKWEKTEASQYYLQRGPTSVVGPAQQAAVTTSGAAIEVTGFAGQKVTIYVSATCRYRWASANTPTTSATTDGGAAARNATTGATGIQASGGILTAGLWDRDVPALSSGETQMFLIITPPTGTVDVNVVQS